MNKPSNERNAYNDFSNASFFSSDVLNTFLEPNDNNENKESTLNNNNSNDNYMNFLNNIIENENNEDIYDKFFREKFFNTSGGSRIFTPPVKNINIPNNEKNISKNRFVCNTCVYYRNLNKIIIKEKNKEINKYKKLYKDCYEDMIFYKKYTNNNKYYNELIKEKDNKYEELYNNYITLFKRNLLNFEIDNEFKITNNNFCILKKINYNEVKQNIKLITSFNEIDVNDYFTLHGNNNKSNNNIYNNYNYNNEICFINLKKYRDYEDSISIKSNGTLVTVSSYIITKKGKKRKIHKKKKLRDYFNETFDYY